MNTMMLLLVILAAILWVWAIYDMNLRRFNPPHLKGLWMLGALLFPLLGPLIYFRMRKSITRERKRKFKPQFD